jgi:hypothetical protein
LGEQEFQCCSDDGIPEDVANWCVACLANAAVDEQKARADAAEGALTKLSEWAEVGGKTAVAHAIEESRLRSNERSHDEKDKRIAALEQERDDARAEAMAFRSAFLSVRLAVDRALSTLEIIEAKDGV